MPISLSERWGSEEIWRRDLVTEHLQVICGGVRCGASAAHHPGQRLTGVIAVPEHREMAEAQPGRQVLPHGSPTRNASREPDLTFGQEPLPAEHAATDRDPLGGERGPAGVGQLGPGEVQPSVACPDRGSRSAACCIYWLCAAAWSARYRRAAARRLLPLPRLDQGPTTPAPFEPPTRDREPAVAFPQRPGSFRMRAYTL